MGQYITTHEFYHAYTDEPHATRRKEILSQLNREMRVFICNFSSYRKISPNQTIDGS